MSVIVQKEIDYFKSSDSFKDYMAYQEMPRDEDYKFTAEINCPPVGTTVKQGYELGVTFFMFSKNGKVNSFAQCRNKNWYIDDSGVYKYHKSWLKNIRKTK
jgi:hypothetical protein